MYFLGRYASTRREVFWLSFCEGPAWTALLSLRRKRVITWVLNWRMSWEPTTSISLKQFLPLAHQVTDESEHSIICWYQNHGYEDLLPRNTKLDPGRLGNNQKHTTAVAQAFRVLRDFVLKNTAFPLNVVARIELVEADNDDGIP